ncbi:MAG: CTQ-dependent lysine 6-oxidase LodA [Pseudomonadota bacterium]
MGQSRREFIGLMAGTAASPLLADKPSAQQADSEVQPISKAGYRIHPAIGVARLGDSGSNLDNPFSAPDTYLIAPQAIGALPTEYNPEDPNAQAPARSFKDQAGQIRRQAARFQIYRDDGKGGSTALTLEDSEVESIRWTVHVANKKAAWYNFAEFEGNLMLGADNSYDARSVPLRNRVIEGAARKQLILDPGPRRVTVPGEVAHFDDKGPAATADLPAYSHASFPGNSGINKQLGYEEDGLYPYHIDTLGAMTMDKTGGLLVLGGQGRAGGPKGDRIESFAGADGYFDDVSDGSVIAELTLRSGETLWLHAWVLTGPPKVAPELVNITTLDDLIFDMAVRHKGAAPELYNASNGSWNDAFIVDYQAHIKPIFERMQRYQWVVDVAPMVAFANPPFDPGDNSPKQLDARRRWFTHLRTPGEGDTWELSPEHQQPLAADGFPLMPLNSGSNSVTNHGISKFLSLTPTQYFLFKQWSEGRFERSGVQRTRLAPHSIDRASVGNCVGSPMSPGIEVTWSMSNPALYLDDDPYRLIVQSPDEIARAGLDPARDETRGGGCQPGDLTKRLSPPWQADFFLCGSQDVSFLDPLINKSTEGSELEHIPPPPTFAAVWWPAQSPLHIYSGAEKAEAQTLDGGISLGARARFQRGVNTFLQAILAWRYLGFIVNQNTGPDADDLPFFTEQERNFDKFRAGKYEFTESGRLKTDVPTEAATTEEMSRHARPIHYYVGRK